MSSKTKAIVSYLIMALILYFVFLLRLSSFHIRTWDESMYAVDAYEMIQSGQYIVPYLDGSIDYMHAKPPFATWLEIISIKLFGYNELSVRLPSAFAGITSCLLVFFFIRKYFNELFAWCTFLVLCTSLGFAHFHTARTGDTDSVFTLFTLLANISLFRYFSDEQKKNKNIFFFFLFFAIAFLTKSFACLLFTPAYFLLFLQQKEVTRVFKKKGFYLGLILFLVLTLGYLFLRQSKDPLYIHTVVSTDLARTASAMDSHNEPFDFYFNHFVNYRFSVWILLFVAGILSLLNSRKEDRTLSILGSWSILLSLVYILVISISSTKLEWYDMPVYPYLAIISGYAVFRLLEGLTFIKVSRHVVLAILFCIPLFYAIKQSHANDMTNDEQQEERISEYLFQKEATNFNFDGWNVADTTFKGPLLFYKYKLQEKGQHLSITGFQEIKENSHIITKDEGLKKYVRENFIYTVIDSFYEVAAIDVQQRIKNIGTGLK